MIKQKLCRFLLLLCVISTCGIVSAEEIFVRNTPYQGRVIGSGMSAELSLEDLAKALEVESRQVDGVWTLGDTPVPGREVEGTIYVSLSALKEAGFRVMHSPALATIDITIPKEKAVLKKDGSSQASASWGEQRPTLIYFGANW